MENLQGRERLQKSNRPRLACLKSTKSQLVQYLNSYSHAWWLQQTWQYRVLLASTHNTHLHTVANYYKCWPSSIKNHCTESEDWSYFSFALCTITLIDVIILIGRWEWNKKKDESSLSLQVIVHAHPVRMALKEFTICNTSKRGEEAFPLCSCECKGCR